MLCYNGTEDIDVNKENVYRKCLCVMNALFVTMGIYKGFKLQSSACNGCHVKSVRSLDMNNIAFLDIHDVDYR